MLGFGPVPRGGSVISAIQKARTKPLWFTASSVTLHEAGKLLASRRHEWTSCCEAHVGPVTLHRIARRTSLDAQLARNVDAPVVAVMAGMLDTAQATYQTYDSSHIRAAGLRYQNAGPEHTSTSLSWAARPDTPQNLKKYRQSTLHTPGQIFRHFGAANDKVDNARTYGKVRPLVQGFG